MRTFHEFLQASGQNLDELFGLFGKKAPKQPPQPEESPAERYKRERAAAGMDNMGDRDKPANDKEAEYMATMNRPGFRSKKKSKKV